MAGDTHPPRDRGQIIITHITELRAKLAMRSRVVASLSGTKWGCDHRTLRSTHLAHVQAKSDYALAAFGPYVQQGQLDGLGTEQYYAACTISGCPRGTRGPVALLEADMQPIQQRVDSAAAVLYERCLRLPPDNHARRVAEQPEPPALQDPEPGPRVAEQLARTYNWRKRAKAVLSRAELDDAGPREPLATYAKTPPWEDWGSVDFHPELCRPVTRRDAPAKRREAALDTLASLPPADLEGYTDGSVLDARRQRQGGGGYVLLDARRPGPVTHYGHCAAGKRCSSYRAELAAMRKLLEDLISGQGGDGRGIEFPAQTARRCEIRIALDSQSAIRALEKGPSAQTGALEMIVWERLIRLCHKRRAHVTVQYVPGHADVDRQEEADTAAKEAARTCEQESVAISLGLVKAALRARLREELVGQVPKGHLWRRAMEGRRPVHDNQSREHQRRMAQLRAGRCVLTQDVAHAFSTRTVEMDVPADGRHGLVLGDGSVTDVTAGSPAEQAGLQPGCRVEKVGRQVTDTDAERQAALWAGRGQRVRLSLRLVPSKACPAGCGEDDGTEHLICKCPAYTAARIAVFGEASPPLTVLQEPIKVCRYLQRIERNRPRGAPAKAGAEAGAGARGRPGSGRGGSGGAATGASQRREHATASGRDNGREARAGPAPNETGTRTKKRKPRSGRPRVNAHELP
eukprot:gene11733-biopygen1758